MTRKWKDSGWGIRAFGLNLKGEKRVHFAKGNQNAMAAGTVLWGGSDQGRY
jgi:hypothetical protein